MKTINTYLLLLFFLFVGTGLLAQQQSELNLHGNLLFYRYDSYNNCESQVAKVHAQQLGIEYAHPLAQRWYIETSLFYSRRAGTYRSRRFNEMPIELFCGIGPYPYAEISNDLDAEKLGVQLALRYHIIERARWVLAVSAGGAPSYDIQKQQFYSDAPSDAANPYQIDAIGTLSCRYNFFKRFHVQLNYQSRYKFGAQDLIYKKWAFAPGMGIGMSI